MTDQKLTPFVSKILLVAVSALSVFLMLLIIFVVRNTTAPTLAEKSVGSSEAGTAGPAKIPTRVEYRPNLEFFNPVTGWPAIWYYKRPDGGYDLFDAPGYHPTYGKEAPLQAVTSTIVGDVEASFKEGSPARKTSALRSIPSRRTLAPRRVASPDNSLAPAASASTVSSLTIPAGTRLAVVLDKQISTGTNNVGDTFPVSLTGAVVIDGQTILAEGVRLTGEIIALEKPGRASGVAQMVLVLKSAGGVPIDTAPLTFKGKSTKEEDAGKIGIGAGIGAAVGALFGGKKGVAKGAAVGAGGGTGIVLATRGQDLVLEPEQTLAFVLSRNATFR